MAHALGEVGGTRASFFRNPEKLLHQAILKGVKRDDADSSPSPQYRQSLLQDGLKIIDFSIDSDPESHKGLGRRVDSHWMA